MAPTWCNARRQRHWETWIVSKCLLVRGYRISALGRLEPWFMGEQINQKEFLWDFGGRNRASPAVPSVKTMVPLTPGPLYLRSAELSVDSGRRIEPFSPIPEYLGLSRQPFDIKDFSSLSRKPEPRYTVARGCGGCHRASALLPVLPPRATSKPNCRSYPQGAGCWPGR